MFKNTIRSLFQDKVWLIDFSAIFFSEKQADGGSPKDFIFPVIIVVVLLLIVVVPGVCIILLWRKGKKGNVIIEAEVIHVYCGFISFSGYDHFLELLQITTFQNKFLYGQYLM